jgi:hypothetical protein
LKVKIVLRNPVNKADQIDYTIDVHDHELSRDWITELKKLLHNGNLLEKNYCFMGFPDTRRNISYLCDELNQAVDQINKFNLSNVWQAHGLENFYIEDYYCEHSVRWPEEYGVGNFDYVDDLTIYQPGLMAKSGMLNRLHNYFEKLQGTVHNLSTYYQLADYNTKYAIRQLNNCCHELENLILGQRKFKMDPQWVRPSQITTWINADRTPLKDVHRQGFIKNGFDRVLGGVYMHWAQIGKTLFEVFRDEGAPDIANTVCEAITHLEYYSGEFDIEWGNSVTYSNKYPWHKQEQDNFSEWLIKNNLDPQDPTLSLGYLPIGQVDLISSFGTIDYQEIWKTLGNYLDIYRIEVDGIDATYNYCWSDNNYKQKQIDRMKSGYDYHKRK